MKGKKLFTKKDYVFVIRDRRVRVALLPLPRDYVNINKLGVQFSDGRILPIEYNIPKSDTLMTLEGALMGVARIMNDQKLMEDGLQKLTNPNRRYPLTESDIKFTPLATSPEAYDGPKISGYQLLDEEAMGFGRQLDDRGWTIKVKFDNRMWSPKEGDILKLL